MSSYLIKKDSATYQILYMEYDIEGYKFTPNNQGDLPYIRVESITIYKPDMIDHLLALKFQKKFDRLSQIIVRFLYQDDEDGEADEGDYFILLDEVARLKSIVDLKYKKFLKNEEYKEYIHKLAFLDNQLRQKIAILNYQNQLNYEVSQGRSM